MSQAGIVNISSGGGVVTSVTGTGSILASPTTGNVVLSLIGLTNHNVLVGQGTATIGLIAPSTAGFVLTSNGIAADPTFQVLPASGVTFAGDTGTPFTTSSVTIQADNIGNACGSTVLFNASTPDITLQVTDSVHGNTFIGLNAGKAGASGNNNTALGTGSLGSITNGDSNCAIGGALHFLTGGANNTAVGVLSQNFMTNNDNNTSVGYNSLSMCNGVSNIAIGSGVAINYTGTETSNIIIGNAGVTGDGHFIRIGTNGGATGQQNQCYIAGIAGASFSAITPIPQGVIIDTSNGQLIASGSAPGVTFAGDTGTPFTTNSVTIYANNGLQNAGSTVSFDASTPFILLNVSDGANNTVIGHNSGNPLLTVDGSNNTVLGSNSFKACDVNQFCCVLGSNALKVDASGVSNIAIGYNSLVLLSGGGSSNIAIGTGAGSLYTGLESSNILIGNNQTGTLGESNVMRIGVAGDQLECFVAGINNTNSSAFSGPLGVYVDSSTGQLGYGAAAGSFPWTRIGVNFNAIPGNGYFISALLTATLPNAPADGSTIAFINASLATLTIQAQGSDVIQLGIGQSSLAGTLTSTNNGDTVTLIYDLTDSVWFAISSIGAWAQS